VDLDEIAPAPAAVLAFDEGEGDVTCGVELVAVAGRLPGIEVAK
jgi:hypothetical protein